MSRIGAGARGALAALAAASSATAAFAAKEIAPYRAALVVSWGEGAGSDAFRDDLARVLGESLAERCFAAVTTVEHDPAGPAPDVAYKVILSHAVDETIFDDTIAGALQPGEPSQELRRVARFEVSVDATLMAEANGAIVNRKHLVPRISRRPIFIGEDPQAIARSQAIDQIVVDLSKSLGCGTPKLTKKIREALGGTARDSAQPR